MTTRRLAPIAVGVAMVAATVVAIVLLGDESALDTDAAQDPPQSAPLDEPDDDGTYRCSATGAPDAPRLTAPTGFHDEPFTLELVSADGDPLYYTLDGSYPDPVANPEATVAYDGPIPVEPNTGPFPLTSTRSAFDRDQLSRGGAAGPEWSIIREPVTGGTVVRARSVDLSAPTTTFDPADLDGADADDEERTPLDLQGTEFQDPAFQAEWETDPPQPDPVERANGSSECVGVFFVGNELIRPELPVVHLAANPDHLFDPDTGIYLPGTALQEYLDSGEFSPRFVQEFFGLVPANYRGRGRTWERPFEHDLDDASVLHLFDPGGAATYTSNVGLRLHGGWTRAFPQKSIRLYARNDYGNRTFEHDVFGEDGADVNRRLLLRNSGNDWEWTMLLDGYVQGLISDWDVETLAFQPAVLFINGEYWGIHNLRERYDRHYLEVAHDVDPDNVAIVSGYGACCDVDTGEPDDAEPYEQLLADLQDMDPTDDATLAYVEERMDVDDLIEFLIAHLYVSNTDWPQNNVKLWREKVDPDPELGTRRDGRWRWLVFDTDFVGDLQRSPFHDPFARMGQLLSDADGDIHADLGVPFLFDRLIQNDGVRDRFATRFADAVNTSFRSERAVAQLDRLTELMSPEIEHHTARWGNASRSGWWPIETTEAWWGRIIELERFFEERPSLARHFASEHLELGDSAELRVRTSDAAHGHVTVNSVEVVQDTPGVDDPTDWTARYFRDVPVTVRATPADGYRFVGWEATPGAAIASEEGEVAVLDLGEDGTTITAVFEPA